MQRPLGVAFVGTLCFLACASPACLASGADSSYVYEAALVRPSLSRVIRIDGDLSEWEQLDAPPEHICHVIVASSSQYQICEPSGTADFSVWFKCILDPDEIYLAVDITDDSLIFGEQPFGDLWNDDSVEIYLDGDLAPPQQINANGKTVIQYDGNDAQIRVSRNGAGGVVLDGMGMFGARRMQLPGLWESLGVVVAVRPHPGGYAVEARIPKIAFVARPFEPGIEFGLDVKVCDDDDGGYLDSNISWSEDPNAVRWRTTQGIGRVRIVREIRLSPLPSALPAVP